MLSLTALFLNLAAAAVAAAALFRLFFPLVTAVECAAAGVPVGLVLSAWTVLLLKSLLLTAPGLSSSLVVGTVVVHVAALVWAVKAWKHKLQQPRVRRWLNDELATIPTGVVVFLTVMCLWLAWMSHTHGLWMDENGGHHVAGTVWADLPFHLNIMSSFLHGANQNASVFHPLKSAFFADTHLAYPFLPDFSTAFMVAAGSSLREALVEQAVLLLGAFVILLYRLGYRLTTDHVASCAGVVLTFCCGGIGVVHLWENYTWDNFIHKDHVFHLVNAPDAFWFSLPAHILFPQRTTQFAYSIDIVILLLVLVSQLQTPTGKKRDADLQLRNHNGRYHDDDDHSRGGPGDHDDDAPVSAAASRMPSLLDSKHPPRPAAVTVSPSQQTQLLVAAGFVTGLLPYLQPHSFVAIGSVVIVVAVMDVGTKLRRNPSLRAPPVVQAVKSWMLYAGVAFAVAIPQMMMFFGRVAHSRGFIRLNAWTFMGLTRQWARSLGLYVPLYALSWLAIRRRFHSSQFFFGALAVFVEANLIIFQPWELDNTKVFYIWVFIASPMVCVVLTRVAHRLKWVGQVLVVATFLSLILSGLTLCYQETIGGDGVVFESADIEYATWIRANTAPTARFLTPVEHSPKHIRVESSLAGREILVGFLGWLSSHGVDYQARLHEQNRVIRGQHHDAFQWLQDESATHITVPYEARRSFNTNKLLTVARLVASNGKFYAFEVRPKPLEAFTGPDCGFTGVSKTDCNNKMCAWVPNDDGEPWCRYPDDHVLDAGQPTMPLLSPDHDCGWHGISQDQCVARGCTWEPAGAAAWCTFRRDPKVHGAGPPPVVVM